MKRTGKSANTGHGRKPHESSATTQGRAEVQAPQVAQTQAEASDSTPAPGGLLPEESGQESLCTGCDENPVAPGNAHLCQECVEHLQEQVLRDAGIAPSEVRSVRFDEKRRVLTVKTRDFAIRELVVPRMST